jgi:Flp pilus assembly pilin Flp
MRNAPAATAIGSGLIASLIARAIIVAVQFFGVNLTASYTTITNAFL